MFSLILVSTILHQAQVKPGVPTKPAPAVPASMAPWSRPAATKVLATVNGSPITAGTVEQYLWEWKVDEVVENLISFELVNLEAKRLHVATNAAEVNATLADELDQFKRTLPAGTDPITALKQKGYPLSRIRLTIKSSVLLDKIALLEFKPTDYVKVSTIIVPLKPSASPTDVAAATKTSQAYYDQLKKGDLWSNVLAASTQDANVTKNGGVIGWRSLVAFPKTGVEEINKLKPGEFTHPMQTPNGIQIFRIDATGMSALPSELSDLKKTYAQSRRNEILKKLRDQAKIVTTQ